MAVQAATGGSREGSLAALMVLQRQLSFEANSFNARLSRIVTKLFTRVIKAEESLENPWGSTDIEKLLLTLDVHLHLCHEAEEKAIKGDEDALASCKDMVKPLVESLFNTSGGVAGIRNKMRNLETDTYDLAEMVAEFDDQTAVLSSEFIAQEENTSLRPAKQSKNVAVLVSALGSAQDDDEREVALANLRQFQEDHGEEDLNIYLEQVSPAFRKFILDQLLQQKQQMENNERALQESTMSERLRLLRSRLHVRDNQSTNSVGSSSSPATKAQSWSAAPYPAKDPNDFSAASVASEEANNMPDTATSAASYASSGSATQSLRERLASAQESRKSAMFGSGLETSSSSSRAAALRERLQKVKEQALQHQ